MSDYLGNLAARALGLSAVARPRPSLFDPRRAAPEPLALEPEAFPTPRTARTEEAARTPTRRERAQPAGEAEPQPGRPGLSADREEEEEAPPGRTLPAEQPLGRTRTRAARPEGDGRAGTPAVVEAGVPHPAVPPPPEPAVSPPDRAIGTAAPVRPARTVPEPGLAARPPSTRLVERAAREPTVRVTIGRIDVRAVKVEEPPAPKEKPRPGPRMSLDEYLGRAGEVAG